MKAAKGTDPTQRFSGRVDHYAQYRPTYPQEVVRALQEECRLVPESRIADIGSGTGILSELFLENGNTVYAVEPNREMREAGEKRLDGHLGFRSVDGRAEATALPDGSVDFVVAGQAFHWFDPDSAREEFERILKPDGIAMIVWNERDPGTTPFLAAFENLLKRHVPDYSKLNFRRTYDTAVARLFGRRGFRSKTFRNRQELDYDGAVGRLLSYSYVPDSGHPNHVPMLEELSGIFRAHQRNGRVAFEYTTRMYYGPLSR